MSFPAFRFLMAAAIPALLVQTVSGQMAAELLEQEPPRITAVQATQGAPRVDGRLDDAVWAVAPVAEVTSTR